MSPSLTSLSFEGLYGFGDRYCGAGPGWPAVLVGFWDVCPRNLSGHVRRICFLFDHCHGPVMQIAPYIPPSSVIHNSLCARHWSLLCLLTHSIINSPVILAHQRCQPTTNCNIFIYWQSFSVKSLEQLLSYFMFIYKHEIIQQQKFSNKGDKQKNIAISCRSLEYNDWTKILIGLFKWHFKLFVPIRIFSLDSPLP